MNWDRIEGNWKEFKGSARQQWGKLTDDQLNVIAGKRDQLAGKIRECYVIGMDETEKQVSDWQARQTEAAQPEAVQPKGREARRGRTPRRALPALPPAPNRTKGTAKWWTRASLTVVSVAVAAMAVGCSPSPSAVAAVISDRIYTVTPNSLKVKSGIVSGEVTELKVTEGVEGGSGRVATPAKLSGKLILKNISTDQTVRLIGGKISYIDTQGHAIALEDNRTEPTISISSSYGDTGRLDPGQDATRVIDAEFPVAALKAKSLKEIRLALTYTPSPYREEMLNFAVSIGGQ